MLPALAASRTSATRSVNLQAEKTATVGSYEISHLRPKKPADLNAWLSENRFSVLPAGADTGGCRLHLQRLGVRRNQAGTHSVRAITPHPVAMTFCLQGTRVSGKAHGVAWRENGL